MPSPPTRTFTGVVVQVTIRVPGQVYDYIVLVGRKLVPTPITLCGRQGRILNGLLVQRQAPIWAGLYKFTPEGVQPLGWVNEVTYYYAQAVYYRLHPKITVEDQYARILAEVGLLGGATWE
jgi:hypothetical protein